MPVPDIFKLCRMSTMLQIWHQDFMHLFLPVMSGIVEILVIDENFFNVDRLSICAVMLLNKCLEVGMLL